MDSLSIGAEVRARKSGPHVEKRLNAAFVRNAPQGRHADGGGLYLQVDGTGARRWLLRITVQGKRRDFGFGSATLVSLADAREKAREWRSIARSGGNPKIQRRIQQGRSTTFSALARVVYDRKFKDKANDPKHIKQWIRTMETFVFPVIGDLSVEDVHQDDIEKVLDPIWTAKPETARRVLQRISTVFDHACARGLRSQGSPTTGLRRLMRDQKDKPAHFKAMDYGDVPKLIKTIEKSNSVGALALAFTTYTAVRSKPVRAATWDQFDDSLNIWTIPEGNMKSREEFIVPLPMPARAILLRLRDNRTHASALVFGSPHNPKKSISENTMRKVLQGHFPGATVHGMRAAFRTWAAEVVEANNDVAEACLAHTLGNSTVRAYKRTDLLDHREVLLEKWAMWARGEWEWFANANNIDGEIFRRKTADL